MLHDTRLRRAASMNQMRWLGSIQPEHPEESGLDPPGSQSGRRTRAPPAIHSPPLLVDEKSAEPRASGASPRHDLDPLVLLRLDPAGTIPPHRPRWKRAT